MTRPELLPTDVANKARAFGDAVATRFPGANVVSIHHVVGTAVDAGAQAHDTAATVPASFSLATLIQLARDEADALRAHQARLVDGGLREAPDAGVLCRAAAWDAIARNLDRVRCDPEIIRLLREVAKAERRQDD